MPIGGDDERKKKEKPNSYENLVLHSTLQCLLGSSNRQLPSNIAKAYTRAEKNTGNPGPHSNTLLRYSRRKCKLQPSAVQSKCSRWALG